MLAIIKVVFGTIVLFGYLDRFLLSKQIEEYNLLSVLHLFPLLIIFVTFTFGFQNWLVITITLPIITLLSILSFFRIATLLHRNLKRIEESGHPSLPRFSVAFLRIGLSFVVACSSAIAVSGLQTFGWHTRLAEYEFPSTYDWMIENERKPLRKKLDACQKFAADVSNAPRLGIESRFSLSTMKYEITGLNGRAHIYYSPPTDVGQSPHYNVSYHSPDANCSLGIVGMPPRGGTGSLQKEWIDILKRYTADIQKQIDTVEYSTIALLAFAADSLARYLLPAPSTITPKNAPAKFISVFTFYLGWALGLMSFIFFGPKRLKD